MTNDNTQSGPGGSQIAQKGNGVSWLWLFVAAAVLTVVFIFFAVMTYFRADDEGMTDIIWARLSFVLQGVEAVAFTAVGWLFGREVHRGEAEVAKDQAVDAKKNADDAKQEAKAARTETVTARDGHLDAVERATAAEMSGWQLAEAVRARAEVAAGSGWTEGAGGNERSPAASVPSGSGMAQLKDLADSLFPPR